MLSENGYYVRQQKQAKKRFISRHPLVGKRQIAILLQDGQPTNGVKEKVSSANLDYDVKTVLGDEEPP